MRNIIGTVLRNLGISGGGVAGGSSGVAGFFKPLASLQPGLPAAAARYIANGDNASVLATLGTSQVRDTWMREGGMYPSAHASHKLGFGTGAPLLATYAQVRLGEIMAALRPLASGMHYGMLGSSTSPNWLRHCLYLRLVPDGAKCLFDDLRALCAVGGQSDDVLLDIVTSADPQRYRSGNAFALFPGVEDWLRSDAATLIPLAGALAAGPRAELIAAIGRLGFTEAYLPFLIASGVADAKRVREAARIALTGADKTAVAGALAVRFPESTPGARAELPGLAATVLRADAKPLLASWQAEESSAKVLAAIARASDALALADSNADASDDPAEGYTALDGETVTLPPRPPIPPASRITDATFALLQPSIDSYSQAVAKAKREAKAEQWHWSRHAAPASLAAMKPLWNGPWKAPERGHAAFLWLRTEAKYDRSGLNAFLAAPDVNARHLLAMIGQHLHFGLFNLFRPWESHPAAAELRRRFAYDDLRMAIELWMELGGQDPIRQHLASEWHDSTEGLEPAMLWPLVAERFALVDEALGLCPRSESAQLIPERALQLLSVLPKVPARYLAPLMTIATGSRKAPRGEARRLLSGARDIDGTIAALLSDGKQEARAGAAEWLGQRVARAQVPALRAALKTEKSEIARAAMMRALERAGDDVSDLFNRAVLLEDAEAGLAKNSKSLDWFPLDLAPALGWADGEIVDPRIVRWWIVLADKLKAPGGNPLIDLWLDRLAPGEAHRLGRFALTSWMEQDTRTATQDEANAHALANIDATFAQHQQWHRQHPQYWQAPDRDALFAQLKRDKIATYLGSAADNRGLLGLATRVDGADAALAARAYLKNHGQRISQAKALLDMLAANPSAAATQVVLATANRFKARTVQAHAQGLIDDISARNGWSTDELADRTIPSGGLDEAGVCVLDCGADRAFTITLDADDAVQLLNPQGKLVKALPSARNPDEEPLLAEAKKQLATARKEVKQVFAAQTERLREAMCVERAWPLEDWRAHLLGHPIAGRLVRRLVWIGLDAHGTALGQFRPHDDGSVTDVRDDAVDLASFTTVKLAHASLTGPDEATAWRAHLADYRIAAPFGQFPADQPILSELERGELRIEDRRGWMIETFKLRGVATKLGYTRSAAGDGGYFTAYEKRFQSADLVALVEFSGSPLPEENAAAALFDLSFAQLRRGQTYHGAQIPLGDVPSVLLSACWLDLHDMADKGKGFDPEWEKKMPWM